MQTFISFFVFKLVRNGDKCLIKHCFEGKEGGVAGGQRQEEQDKEKGGVWRNLLNLNKTH